MQMLSLRYECYIFYSLKAEKQSKSARFQIRRLQSSAFIQENEAFRFINDAKDVWSVHLQPGSIN